MILSLSILCLPKGEKKGIRATKKMFLGKSAFFSGFCVRPQKYVRPIT